MGTKPRQKPEGNSEPTLLNLDPEPGVVHGPIKVTIPCDLCHHSEAIVVFLPFQIGAKLHIQFVVAFDALRIPRSYLLIFTHGGRMFRVRV